MDPAAAQIIVTIITVCVPAITTLITTRSVKRQANKHSSRSDIMQLIIEDHVRIMEGKLPENRQLILEQYDAYKNAGGNSYIHKKVEEYEIWYAQLTKERSKNAKR